MFTDSISRRFRRTRVARSHRFVPRAACESLEDRTLLSTTAVVLNEVWATPFGLSNSNRYVEISGPAGETLGDVEFVQFDGFGGGTPKGTASYVKDLSGLTLGSNGLLLLEPATGGVVSLDPATVTVKDPNFALAGGSDLYALVDYTNGSPITQGDQVDPANTGVLDLTQFGTGGASTGDTIIDGIEFVFHSTPDVTDRAYDVTQSIGGVTSTYSHTNFFLPVGTVTPDAATREAAGTYLTTAGYDPTAVFSYGFTAFGTQQYQANGATTVFHAATGSGAFTSTNGYAVTPGGANDVAVLVMSASTASVQEGTAITITVTRTNGTTGKSGAGDETIQYQTADITAIDGTNYTGTSGTFTFTPGGPDTQSFTITTANTGQSSDLQFLVLLNHPGNTFLGQPFFAIVTITA